MLGFELTHVIKGVTGWTAALINCEGTGGGENLNQPSDENMIYNVKMI